MCVVMASEATAGVLGLRMVCRFSVQIVPANRSTVHPSAPVIRVACRLRPRATPDLGSVTGMALLEIDDLPVETAAVLRRRADATGLPVREHLRRELIALAARRVPIDAVVDFLRAERPERPGPQIDTGAMALIDIYDLPADAWSVFSARAAAAGLPLGEYVRKELITLARRRTVDDSILEIREALGGEPDRDGASAALAASIRYARGE